MSAYTPGPWRWDGNVCNYNPEEEAPWIVAGKNDEIAVLTGGISCANEADARLIAAAPEQHEANKTSLCVLCALLDANDWHPNMRKDIEFAIAANRAAIAKATGSQP